MARSDRRAGSLRLAAGAAELVGLLGGEITAVVREVHAASSPLAWLGTPRLDAAVYAPIGLAFDAVGWVAARAGRVAAAEPAPDSWLDLQSALDGAFGHRFERSGGAFALPMSLHRRDPRASGDRLIVFLHGLCMNERAWANPAHERFAAWAEQRLGARLAHLRYNTGLRISANGARLAELLEREVTEPELMLVGHSMGGLLAVGALHQAAERGLAWPGRVTRVACLGTPHEGASLERLGNHANRLLRVSPWTRPFTRLGDLRSDGIRDLRFGHVLDADWRARRPDDPRPSPSGVRLAPHVEHLFVAASLSGAGERDRVGDWLVSVESALARRLHAGTAVRRERIHGLDHLGLLRDERVYAVLRRWLGDGS